MQHVLNRFPVELRKNTHIYMCWIFQHEVLDNLVVARSVRQLVIDDCFLNLLENTCEQFQMRCSRTERTVVLYFRRITAKLCILRQPMEWLDWSSEISVCRELDSNFRGCRASDDIDVRPQTTNLSATRTRLAHDVRMIAMWSIENDDRSTQMDKCNITIIAMKYEITTYCSYS